MNLHGIKKTAKPINTIKREIKQFIDIQMSIVNFPAYFMYWAHEIQYAPIADVMFINQYQSMREYLHVKDDFHPG